MKLPVPLFIAIVLSLCALSSLPATTVMIQYDIILDADVDPQQVPYIQETSIDLEGGIMNELFDKGHIVFNMPGEVYVKGASLPEETEIRSRRVRHSMEAGRGGANVFIYLGIHFAGELEEDIHLSKVDYEIMQIGEAALDYDMISYPPLPRTEGVDASMIFLDHVGEKGLFWRLIE